MTKEEFYNYKFSINTEILYDDNWYKIEEIDFEYESLLLRDYKTWIGYNDVVEIKH